MGECHHDDCIFLRGGGDSDMFFRGGGGGGGQRDVFSGKVTVVGREEGWGIEVFTLARVFRVGR